MSRMGCQILFNSIYINTSLLMINRDFRLIYLRNRINPFLKNKIIINE